MSSPVVLPWADHLDALEEWLRQGRALLEAPEGTETPLPPLGTVPAGPLPAELHLRAQAGLQELERLQQVGERRRRGLARGEAYSRY